MDTVKKCTEVGDNPLLSISSNLSNLHDDVLALSEIMASSSWRGKNYPKYKKKFPKLFYSWKTEREKYKMLCSEDGATVYGHVRVKLARVPVVGVVKLGE